MRKRTIWLLGLGLAFMTLKADSCVTEERDVDVVVTADIPAEWHTEGDNSSGQDTLQVNANEDIEEALDELDDEAELVDINLAGVCYEVLENNGFVGAHSGTVTIDGLPLLSFSAPSNATGVTGGTEGAEVTLLPQGTNYVNDLMDDYLASYIAGNPDEGLFDDLVFIATWNSTPPGEDEYNFDWKTCLIMQVIGEITVDVPDP